MMSSMPARTVRVSESKLNSYLGECTKILRQLLKTLGYSSNVVVKVFSYFDGCILAKYRVVIHLPVELGLPIIFPYADARSSALAYEMAVVEVITSIRTHKVKELAGMIFMSIPCGDFNERVHLDHLTFVKAKPEVAACYLD
jgi:hypothetical protein